MSLVDKFKLSMSPEALREKYKEEREKRLRPGGNDQYQELKGKFEEFDEDSYVDEKIVRGPIVEETEVVIVGGGFGGMLQAAHLRKNGVDDFRIIEKGGDFGGTWYWNRYPGAACDVESYIYLPLLDDTGYVPTEKYAKAPEIHAYCQMLAKHFRMYDAAIFQTQVTAAEWDETAKRWIVSTNRGDRISARYLVVAGGILHKAKLPGIPGIEDFQGKAFHTSHWDYDITGGGPLEKMVKLADMNVGIIGTGATSIQAVPKLAETAKQLYVFQRTPSAVGPRGNRPTDPQWAAALKPGWQHERLKNFLSVMSYRRPDVDLIDDGWTHIWLRNGEDRASSPEELEEAASLADYERMDEIRQRIDDTVKDKATAEALKPWYGQHCKRPGFHDEYLEAFNQPNVKLVDTLGKGVERVTRTGVVVEGKEYPLDLLIYASGFEVTTEFTRRMGFNPVGPGGHTLRDAWSDVGAETLHGTFVRHFPNMFVIGTVQGGAMANFVQMIHQGAIHIAHLIQWAVEHKVETIQPTQEATDAWAQMIMSKLWGMAKYTMECTPSYINNEGDMRDMKLARNAPYMGAPDEYIDILEQWRADGWTKGERDLDVTYQ